MERAGPERPAVAFWRTTPPASALELESPSSARPEIVAGQKDRAGAKTAGAGGGTARLGTPLELLDFKLKGGFDVLLVHGISPFIDRTEGDDGEIRILLPGSPSNLRNRE
jgi:hypothetical protein